MMASATTATATPAAARIEVLSLSAVSAGNLKAFASVKIGPSLVIHKCRVIQQPDQRPWATMPQERWESRDGQAHYVALVELAGSLKTRVEAAILQAAQQQGLITTDTGKG